MTNQLFDPAARHGFADPRLALVEALDWVGPAFARWIASQPDDTGISYPRARVLRLLQRRGPQTPTQLADGLGMRQPTVTGLLAPLVADGLVRRATHPDDRRSVLIELTDRGARLDWTRPRIEAAARAFDTLSDSQVRALIAGLHHVAAQLHAGQPAR